MLLPASYTGMSLVVSHNALAKQRGVYKGRQSKFTDDEFKQMREDFANTKNKAALAKRWGISRAYLYRVAKAA